MTGQIILGVTYGLVPKDKYDPFMVDYLPFLKWIPEWVPGATFKRVAREGRALEVNMEVIPYGSCKADILCAVLHICPLILLMKDNNIAGSSFVHRALKKLSEERSVHFTEDDIKATAGTMFAGGADTTLSVLTVVVMGLVRHSEVLAKAQLEVDVVFDGELPDFAHREALSYVTAIILEAARWMPVAPLGAPRISNSEDVFKGYRIPSGTLVFANMWIMLQDPKMYPNPLTFNPDRFIKNGKLDPNVRDPTTIAFGFGRRICPGQKLAFDTLWLTIASMITVFNITTRAR
ncbi:hypothetical protein AX16_007842 [Volvariella volvacea WC 439]|nr:hypothetical protein AX16_007842 [Volvariella volvacea WC 439]